MQKFSESMLADSSGVAKQNLDEGLEHVYG
jgi:hypothetical protein